MHRCSDEARQHWGSEVASAWHPRAPLGVQKTSRKTLTWCNHGNLEHFVFWGSLRAGTNDFGVKEGVSLSYYDLSTWDFVIDLNTYDVDLSESTFDFDELRSCDAMSFSDSSPARDDLETDLDEKAWLQIEKAISEKIGFIDPWDLISSIKEEGSGDEWDDDLTAFLDAWGEFEEPVSSDKFDAFRGGAGGAHATKQKRKLRETIEQLHSLLTDIDSWDEEGPDHSELSNAIDQLSSMVSKWKTQVPRKQEAQDSLKQLSAKLMDAEHLDQNKQSFYFRANMFEERFNLISKGKGKGKKGKGKGKGFENPTAPRFDLRKLYPSRQIASWVSVRSALEGGEPPSGAIAICLDQDMAMEFQLLAKLHEIKSDMILVSRLGKDENVKATGGITQMIPYIGNLALAQALICRLDSWKPEAISVTIQDKTAKSCEKLEMVTLRLTVVLELLAPSDRQNS